MSKSVAYFVIIRDGQKQCFEDRWASPYRELVWGADDLQEWLVQGDETDYDPEDLSGGAVVNFDSRELVWFEREALEIPRVMAVHQRLMEKAWPGFQIRCTSDREFYSAINESADDEDDDDWHDRCETVREAAGLYDDDEEPDEDEEEDDDDYEMTGAWVTVLDTKGKARHRNIEQISEDLVAASKEAIEHLAKLKAAEVPPEKAVAEGMWLDVNAREIGFWGGSAARRDFERLQQSWDKWTVRWAENGYAEQCQASSLPGVPMSDAEALGTFIPRILSTERFDFGNVIGAMGGAAESESAEGGRLSGGQSFHSHSDHRSFVQQHAGSRDRDWCPCCGCRCCFQSH